MKHIILFSSALSLAMLVAGCAEAPEPGPAAPGQQIAIATTVAPREEDATRGELTGSQEEMTDFGLFCSYTGGADWSTADPYAKMSNEHMIKSGAAVGRYDYWTYASGTPVTWNTGAGATANDRYTFFAYTPYSNAAQGISALSSADITALGAPAGIPYIKYITPASLTAQPDLMVATQRYNVRPTGNPVDMEMNHALTAVRFRAYGTGEQIASIAITGFCDRAIKPLGGNDLDWDLTRVDQATGQVLAAPLATPSLTEQWYDVAISPGAAASATGDVMEDGEWLMMIPQALSASARLRVTFSDGNPTRYFTLNNQVWTAGKRMTFVVTISSPVPVSPNPFGEVEVNGIIWAATNVATSGTFAATPYIYDGANQYTYAASMGDDTTPGVCPSGWRLPARMEYEELIAASLAGSGRTDNAGGSGVTGWTFVTPNGNLFFAASGYNSASGVGNIGWYRSYTELSANLTYNMNYNFNTPSDPRVLQANIAQLYSVRCVRPASGVNPSPTPTFISPENPGIIYWDDATKTMQIGSWKPVTGGAVTSANQLFFNFGGITGFLNSDDGTTAFDPAVDIKFNVTNFTDYQSLPNWDDYTGDKTTRADGYISSAAYHNTANVLAGFGDPCKLVGFTVAQIKAGYIDNGRFRMSTATEEVNARWQPYGTPGSDHNNTTYGILNPGQQFAPATGARNPAGTTYAIDSEAWFWTSSTNGAPGYYLANGALYGDGAPGSAMPVRCLGQTQYTITLVNSSHINGTAGVNGNSAATSATEGQLVTLGLNNTSSDPGYAFVRWDFSGPGAALVNVSLSERLHLPCNFPMPPADITITIVEGPTSPTQTMTVPNNSSGVGGAVWANGYLDNKNAFSLSPQDSNGNYFQWGNDVAWTNYIIGTGIPYYPAPTVDLINATSWPAETDPCPDGWRVPTRVEFEQLLAVTDNYPTGDVMEPGTSNYLQFGLLGYLNSIGALSDYQYLGCFWLSDGGSGQASGTSVYVDGIDFNPMTTVSTFGKENAFLIRCVQDLP